MIWGLTNLARLGFVKVGEAYAYEGLKELADGGHTHFVCR